MRQDDWNSAGHAPARPTLANDNHVSDDYPAENRPNKSTTRRSLIHLLTRGRTKSTLGPSGDGAGGDHGGSPILLGDRINIAAPTSLYLWARVVWSNGATLGLQLGPTSIDDAALAPGMVVRILPAAGPARRGIVDRLAPGYGEITLAVADRALSRPR